MDNRSIEKMIQRRERGYIWLERELKRNLAVSTAGLAALLAALRFLGTSLTGWCLLCILGLAANGIWCYLSYRREYRNYESIIRYLNAFEKGSYEFQLEGEYMEQGVHAQIVDQLERLGRAFGVLKERLEREKEGTRELVTDISHQLKTPVAALGLTLELLGDADVTPAERQECLDKEKEDQQELTHLLGTLTNLSRMEADMIRLQPEEGSLKDTLRRAVSGIWFQAQEKGIALEVEEFADIRLRHDAKWTAQAILNVLENAVKYSPSGTAVKLRVVPYVSYVFIEVEDGGIGIPKGEYSEIFKRFYRGRSKEVQEAPGAGVGLYLVRKILEEQGGSVRAVPAKPQGTIFQMMLPKA